MSERYSRLFTLPENLYAVGSPVVIAAGTLLKDNQTGKIVAQLKLRSISGKTIRAVKVRLDMFDTAGNPIGEAVVYDYLDLDASRDAEFGQKSPIPVSENKARSYKASVTEVVFGDQSVWRAGTTEWKSLPRQKTLDAVLRDSELVKQYRIAVGSNFSYYPLAEKDLWYCACGALNHESEKCHTCHRTLFELQTIDLEQLAKDRDVRLAEEARQAAEEKAAADAQKKKTAKILKIVISVVCAVIAVAVLVTKVIIPNGKYNDAVALMEAGEYGEAIVAFEAIDGYKDSAEQIVNCEDAIEAAEQARIEAEKASAYLKAEELAENGDAGKAAIAFAKLGEYQDAGERSLTLWAQAAQRKSIATGYKHSVGVKKDGTVVAIGGQSDGQCNVSDWAHIVAIDAENGHTVGLKTDGTVIAVGYNDDGQCNVSDWTNIVDIAAGSFQTVGLKADGTVIAVGWNEHGQCNVSDWKDMVAISAGGYHTVGVKADGTVEAVGNNEKGQCNVSDWTDIVAIAAGRGHTVGLKADGTVIAVGLDSYGQCDVSDWTDIVAISADNGQTVGLKADGTVVAVGYNDYGQCDTSNWTDIVAIAAGSFHTIGLRADGSMETAGWNDCGQCDVSDWKDIKLPN